MTPIGIIKKVTFIYVQDYSKRLKMQTSLILHIRSKSNCQIELTPNKRNPPFLIIKDTLMHEKPIAHFPVFL